MIISKLEAQIGLESCTGLKPFLHWFFPKRQAERGKGRQFPILSRLENRFFLPGKSGSHAAKNFLTDILKNIYTALLRNQSRLPWYQVQVIVNSSAGKKTKQCRNTLEISSQCRKCKFNRCESTIHSQSIHTDDFLGVSPSTGYYRLFRATGYGGSGGR